MHKVFAKMFRVCGDKREKGKRKNQGKIGKIRRKIEKGEIEENNQIWLKTGTNG